MHFPNKAHEGGLILDQKQQKLLGQLVSIGVPLPVALTAVLSPDPAGDVAAGLEMFNTGANTVLDAVAQPKKTKRKASAYARKYKAAFKTESKKHKTKSGKWKKGGFKAAVKAAHKKAGKK